jgi:hypothetical protein
MTKSERPAAARNDETRMTNDESNPNDRHTNDETGASDGRGFELQSFAFRIDSSFVIRGSSFRREAAGPIIIPATGVRDPIFGLDGAVDFVEMASARAV